MEYRTLGLSGLRVSAVGLGCMGMSHAYGAPPDRKEMNELLSYAVDMGYTLFDTAEVYGTPDRPHDNEELLSEALRPQWKHLSDASRRIILISITNTASTRTQNLRRLPK